MEGRPRRAGAPAGPPVIRLTTGVPASTMGRVPEAAMRYRRLSYRYTMVVRAGQTWPLGHIWQSDRLRLLGRAGWRPDAGVSETATTVESDLDPAGVGAGRVQFELFEDAL